MRSYTQDYSVPNILPTPHPQLQHRLLDILLICKKPSSAYEHIKKLQKLVSGGPDGARYHRLP